MTHSPTPGRGRRQLITVAAIFFLPLLLAWGMILTGWRPAGTTNNGVLIEPPVPLETAGWEWADGSGAVRPNWFDGRWAMLALLPDRCAEACLARLDELHRVHVALGEDIIRVRLVALAPEDGFLDTAAVPSDVRLARLPSATLEKLRGGSGAPQAVSVQIVDYLGFRMMRFPAPVDGSALLEDLETLLKRASEDIERYERNTPAQE